MSYDPFVTHCCECGEEIRGYDPWEEVTGWTRKRDQGGANRIAMRRPTNRFMCKWCMEKLLAGVHANQLRL